MFYVVEKVLSEGDKEEMQAVIDVLKNSDSVKIEVVEAVQKEYDKAQVGDWVFHGAFKRYGQAKIRKNELTKKMGGRFRVCKAALKDESKKTVGDNYIIIPWD